MPDVLSHALAAYLVSPIITRRRFPLLFVVGGILPDIFSRPLTVFGGSIHIYCIGEAMHSPFSALIISYGLSFLFPEGERRGVFLILSLGALFHLLLDSFQHNLIGGYQWLLPFSRWTFEFKLFWPEHSIYALPILSILSLTLYLYLRKRNGGLNE